MLLAEITGTSDAVASSRSRLAKIERLAATLRQAAPDEVLPTVAYLSGELPQRQIGVGYASLRDLPPPAEEPALTVADTDAALTEIGALSGPGSAGGRRRLLGALFARATPPEQHFLVRLLTGELRQGALEGVMAEAIARAAALPAAEVRRALLLRGNLAAVAQAALEHGVPALRAFHLEVGRALQPMLAQSDTDVAAALERIHPAAVEWKLDGIRVQVHHTPGGEVRVFTRSLDDITARVPEVAEVVRAVGEHALVLDGEVIALRPDGRPHPFQVTGARTRSSVDVEGLRASTPLTTFFFDLLHADGEDWIDRPGAERYEALAALLPKELLIPRIVTAEVAEAAVFLEDALARGHEGVMVKSLDATYAAGRRGAGWVKVKPVHTLDLVVLAAEWGHGRRQGWLSNLHLGALDPATGGFVMLGKTFKGLTDELLTWQTGKFQELKSRDEGWVVHLRPELVVEIAFDGVQTSPRYPGGMALRFARVLRYREDKRPGEADTVDTVRAIHKRQDGG